MTTASDGRIANGTVDAWVQLPDESAMQAIVNQHPYAQGFVPGMMRLINAHPKIGPLFGQMFHQIMFSSDGELNRRERKMVATAATVAQDCFY